VARLLGDHGEDDEAQLAVVEKAGAVTVPAMMMVSVMSPMVTAFRLLGMGESTVWSVAP
jgi:hypothetical protein